MERGQVWIETVLYTMIGLVLIGLVLGFVNPKIEESKDNLIIEQTLTLLNDLDSKINIAQDNIRIASFSIKSPS